jgi:MFS family permease
VRSLIRQNVAFRRLWLAEAVSLAGDWFTLIALAVVVSRQTGGSGLAVGALVVTQLFPWVVVGPWGGMLADRFDRRRLLIATDLARTLNVLLLIPAANGGPLWLVLLLVLVHFSLASIFEPARSALVPRLVASHQLVSAGTLSSVTWSVMLAAGGMLGGSVLSVVGVSVAFLVDAATFLASAALIAGIPARAGARAAEEPQPTGRVRFREGLAWSLAHPGASVAVLVKAINGVAIIDTFLVLYATRLFVWGEGGVLSIGFLWGCFGVGAILGPVLLNRLSDGSVPRLRRLIAVGAALLSCALFVLAGARSLLTAGAGFLLRGMGGSANWTYSSVILQKTVPDRMLGRLSALDLLNANVSGMTFSLLWGLRIDRDGLQVAVLGAALVSLVPLLAWTITLRPLERSEEPSAH